jgi:diguanylate cyclase (GGDEF)-like protein
MKSWLPLWASVSGSLPTIVVLVVVVAVGARLMYLSVQHHAAVEREAAVTVGATFAAKIEPPLLALASSAARGAASAHAVPAHPTEPRLNVSTTHTFGMAANDTVLRASSDESDLAAGIASEWQSAESVRTLPSSAILGPMRLGSRWIIAARAPAASSNAGEPDGRDGWSVAYSDLEDLIAESHLARLVDMGYDFQLSQIMSRGTQPRIFVGSSFKPLADAVGTRVRLPIPSIPGSYLELAIRPHAGWYPVNLLAADVGLLAFLAWLLAFGTHDMTHALQRSRGALATARRRLRSLSQQLASEMQQRINLQETFSHALFHDAFTGLPNRRYFMDRLDRALRDVRAKQRSRIAVIIVDITRFKLINDLLGHTAGDELMVQAARRFEKSAAGFEGVLARWGGDQFALLLLKVESTREALSIGALLREDLRLPFQLRRHQFVVAASVGVTCTDSGQRRAEDVVREADIALSVAKQSESSKILLYTSNMSSQAATLVSLEADLHVALEKHQLHLLMQPVVDLRTYRMVGAEALLRWLHPVESVLAPVRFLRIAEEAGLMVPITRWVILRVLKIAANWIHRMPVDQPFYISINLSPTALRDPELAAYVGTLLRETGISPAFIKFEVTEAALINNVAAVRETLEQLHALGVGLMLDDFGTGFTSLSNLQLFPFDFVKIERPFVNLDDADQANTGMMAAMVQMAASLKLTAIAEIIESEAAATALQQMGCEYGQGYYFSGPIEAEEALRRLRSQEPFQPQGASDAPEASDHSSGASPTQRVVPSADSSRISIPAPVEDSSPTVIFLPFESPATTATMRPLEEPADTRAVRPLEDPADPTAMPPLSDRADTMAMPLFMDPADTMAVPPLTDPADTMAVPPLNDSGDTMIMPPLKDPADDLAIPPLNDSGDTMGEPPLKDPADTPAVPPLTDPADTMAVPPLKDPADDLAVPPFNNPGDTMAVPPLKDPAHTMAVAPKDPADTMAVPPLNDSGDTMIMPPLKDPADDLAVPPFNDPGDTMAVPPLNDSGDTMIMPPLDDPWSVDSLPTVMPPAQSSEPFLAVEVPARRNAPLNPQSDSPKQRNLQNARPRDEESGIPAAEAADAGYRRGKDENP